MRARARITLGLLVLPFGLACGLGIKGQGEAQSTSPDGAPPTIDEAGAIDAAVVNDASITTDGEPVDAGDGCTVLIDDDFTTQRAEWENLGSAAFENGGVMLTPKGQGLRAGAIWWKMALSFTGRLNVRVDFLIDSAGVTPGDGIMIAWAGTTAKYVLGSTGQAFGLCGAGMDAVAAGVDSRDNQLALLKGVSMNCQTSGGVKEADVLGASRLIADFTTTRIRGVLDTNANMQRDDVSIATTGYFGITGATGNGESLHLITRLLVRSCP